MLRNWVFIFCALFAEFAFPISRIGNNRIRIPQELFSLEIPKNFASVTEVHDGGLVLASGRFASSPPLPVDIQMQPFRTQYPSLVGKSQKEIASYFEAQKDIHYVDVKTSNDALSMLGESDSSYVAISACGDGRGYVLFAPKFEMIAQGMTDVLKTTNFEAPCPK